jgi:hypothetical protein
MVKTNTPNKPVLHLTVTGNVEKFVTIDPKRISLRGVAGSRIKSIVRIVPEEKYPFKITESQASNGKNIRFKLQTLNNTKKEEYMLLVENLKKDKGRYVDTIKLKTDSKIKPEIKIYVYGYIMDPPKNKKK